MKILILFLISFNLWASYLPESKIGESTDGMTIHSKPENCEAQYSEPCIRFSENMPYSKIIQEQNLEANNISCILCDDEYAALLCDEGWRKVKGALSVYCAKRIPKYIGHNLALKAAHDESKRLKKEAKDLLKTTFKSKKGVGFSNMTKEEQDALIEYLIDKVN